jgi:hypothetical protein
MFPFHNRMRKSGELLKPEGLELSKEDRQGVMKAIVVMFFYEFCRKPSSTLLFLKVSSRHCVIKVYDLVIDSTQ